MGTLTLFVRAFSINPADSFTTPSAAQQVVSTGSELKLTCAAVGSTAKQTVEW